VQRDSTPRGYYRVLPAPGNDRTQTSNRPDSLDWCATPATLYFHVVFTVPELIAEIAFYNKETVYGILFRAIAETLLTIARDPKHLGAEIGFFAILHTSKIHFGNPDSVGAKEGNTSNGAISRVKAGSRVV
jgi:hypothetical protein